MVGCSDGTSFVSGRINSCTPSSATFRLSQVSLQLKIKRILQNTNLETHPAETWWTKCKYASITAMVLFCLQ